MLRLLFCLCCALPAVALQVDAETFDAADANGDGIVTPAELPRARIFASLDRDGDGRITRAEVGLPEPKPLPPLKVPPRRLPLQDAPLVGERLPAAIDDLIDLDTLLAKHAALVIVLRDPGCPVGAKLRGDLLSLEADLRTQSVLMLRIGISDDAAAMQGDDAGFTGPRLDDTGQRWTGLLQASRSTEVFLVDRARTLRYRGALSDRVGIGYELATARDAYLRDAIAAVLAGRSVDVPATDAPGCALTVAAAVKPAAQAPTWHSDIARIMQQRCQSCHHADGVAPFPLETHGQVSGRRRAMIREVVDERRMPPWFAEPAHGHWANDRSLSADERQALLAWIDADCPEGDPAQAPLPLTHSTEWNIGTPDLILDIGTAQHIPASGAIPYRRAVVTNPLSEDVWIEAYEIRPTAPSVVHHVLVFLEEEGEKRSAGGVRGFFAGMVPGQNLVRWQPGLARRLPAGARLSFQLHYTTNGHATTDQTRIAFRFAKVAPDREVVTRSAATVRFEIPPQAANHAIVAEHRFTRDTTLLAFMPHMHVRGKAFRYELVQADGSTQILLDIPTYDFNWQLRYDCSQPILAKAGSRLRATAHYDNSAGNPANPDPSSTVRHGEQTWDEMMIGYFEAYE